MTEAFLETFVQDKAFELNAMREGDVAGLPDESDVEVVFLPDGTGRYFVSHPQGRVTVADFATDAQRSALALSIARASLGGAL